MLEHSIIGASVSHRWIRCPGSVMLGGRDFPVSPTSELMAQGTAAHTLGEMCLNNRTPAERYLGEQIPVEEYIFEVDTDMTKAVQVYVDAVNQEYKSLYKSKLVIEKQFCLEHLHPELYGRNDACVIQPFGKLVVFDYKHGAGVFVEVEENPQLMYYALGAMIDNFAEEVELVVVQPRCFRKGTSPVRRWKASMRDLIHWGETVLKPKAILALSENAPLESGTHCDWCPKAAICPELKKHIVKQTQSMFQSKEELEIPDFTAMPLRELGSIKSKISCLKALIDQYNSGLSSYLSDCLDKGRDVPGWKMVPGRTTRKWEDEDNTKKRLFTKLKDGVYAPLKIKTVKQMEDTIKSKGLDPNELLKDLVSYNHNTRLAPETDDGESVPNLSEFFKPKGELE